MITIDQYFMGRDKTYSKELTNEFINNAKTLLVAVNKLLKIYGTYPSVNSGWRPPSVNKAAGGSLKSNHMICRAVDLNDDDGALDAWCMEHQELLKELGLFLEHPSKTPRWCHLQNVPPRSGKQVFMP